MLARRLRANAAAAGTSADDVRIVAVDLQEMAPIEGVALIQGDITSAETAQRVLAEFREGDGERRADFVVCDGAPDVTGMHDLDEYIQAQLLLAALAITTALLQPGRHLRRQDLPQQGRHAAVRPAQGLLPRGRQAEVERTSSVEAFVVGRGFAPPPGSTPPR